MNIKDKIVYNICQRVYFPITDEHGQFRLMETRIVAVEEERMSIYSFAYYVYVKDTLYRLHYDDLFLSPVEFCKAVNSRVVRL